MWAFFAVLGWMFFGGLLCAISETGDSTSLYARIAPAILVFWGIVTLFVIVIGGTIAYNSSKTESPEKYVEERFFETKEAYLSRKKLEKEILDLKRREVIALEKLLEMKKEYKND